MTTLIDRMLPLTLSQDISWNRVKDTCADAQPSITFWGTRIVTFNDGSQVSLNELAERIAATASFSLKNHDLSIEERLDGIAITRKFDGFYEATDGDINHANVFTQFFNWIQEFFFRSSSMRPYVENESELDFLTYTPQQMKSAFPDDKVGTLEIRSNGICILVNEGRLVTEHAKTPVEKA